DEPGTHRATRPEPPHGRAVRPNLRRVVRADRPQQPRTQPRAAHPDGRPNPPRRPCAARPTRTAILEPMTTVDHLRQVRLGNLRTVLLALVDRPGSRADLAARTGLTKATLSNLTEPLLDNGILVEDAATLAGMGRPSK